MSLTEPGAAGTRSSRSWTHDALVSLPARTRIACDRAAASRTAGSAVVAHRGPDCVVRPGSYTDNYDGEVGLIDAIYYATVTITTTGYGDITPVAPHARVISAVSSRRCGSRSWCCWSGRPWRCWPTMAGAFSRRTLEETDAQSRRGCRLRHQGQERGRDAADQWREPRQWSSSTAGPRRSPMRTCVGTPPSKVTRLDGTSCGGPRS